MPIKEQTIKTAEYEYTVLQGSKGTIFFEQHYDKSVDIFYTEKIRIEWDGQLYRIHEEFESGYEFQNWLVPWVSNHTMVFYSSLQADLAETAEFLTLMNHALTHVCSR